MTLTRYALRICRTTAVLESQEFRPGIGLGNPEMFVEPIRFTLGHDPEGRSHEVTLTRTEAERLRDALVERLREFDKMFPKTEATE